MILRQLDNNGISVKSKRGKEFEYAMMIGWLTGQSEETDKLDPFISMLCMCGRRLTDEKEVAHEH
jgi:phage terminase Nu1 subunit (DNA packaging protein)